MPNPQPKGSPFAESGPPCTLRSLSQVQLPPNVALRSTVAGSMSESGTSLAANTIRRRTFACGSQSGSRLQAGWARMCHDRGFFASPAACSGSTLVVAMRPSSVSARMSRAATASPGEAAACGASHATSRTYISQGSRSASRISAISSKESRCVPSPPRMITPEPVKRSERKPTSRPSRVRIVAGGSGGPIRGTRTIRRTNSLATRTWARGGLPGKSTGESGRTSRCGGVVRRQSSTPLVWSSTSPGRRSPHANSTNGCRDALAGDAGGPCRTTQRTGLAASNIGFPPSCGCETGAFQPVIGTPATRVPSANSPSQSRSSACARPAPVAMARLKRTATAGFRMDRMVRGGAGGAGATVTRIE